MVTLTLNAHRIANNIIINGPSTSGRSRGPRAAHTNEVTLTHNAHRIAHLNRVIISKTKEQNYQFTRGVTWIVLSTLVGRYTVYYNNLSVVILNPGASIKPSKN